MERILQVGTGRFLRGFVEAFIDDSERARVAVGLPPGARVTVVETTGSGMAGRLAEQGYRYFLHTRGLERGQLVNTSRTIQVIDRSVDASERTDAVIEAVLGSDVTTIVSNATEQGYAQGRYPRLLATLLVARARARMAGLVILPCELLDRNGDLLRRLVADELVSTAEAPAIVARVLDGNAWATTMVDRIVAGPPPSDPGSDAGLDIVVEPYSSWVIEVDEDAQLPRHPSVKRTRDVTTFALRKIRILNGAHTGLVARTRGGRYKFVREALDDPDIHDWLEGLMREEIVPAMADRIVDGQEFVTSVLERLRNPFIDHRLADIGTGHPQKLRSRLLPTYHDYLRLFGQPPRRLSAILDQEGVIA